MHLAFRRLMILVVVSAAICFLGSVLPGCILAVVLTRVCMQRKMSELMKNIRMLSTLCTFMIQDSTPVGKCRALWGAA